MNLQQQQVIKEWINKGMTLVEINGANLKEGFNIPLIELKAFVIPLQTKNK